MEDNWEFVSRNGDVIVPKKKKEVKKEVEASQKTQPIEAVVKETVNVAEPIVNATPGATPPVAPPVAPDTVPTAERWASPGGNPQWTLWQTVVEAFFGFGMGLQQQNEQESSDENLRRRRQVIYKEIALQLVIVVFIFFTSAQTLKDIVRYKNKTNSVDEVVPMVKAFNENEPWVAFALSGKTPYPKDPAMSRDYSLTGLHIREAIEGEWHPDHSSGLIEFIKANPWVNADFFTFSKKRFEFSGKDLSIVEWCRGHPSHRFYMSPFSVQQVDKETKVEQFADHERMLENRVKNGVTILKTEYFIERGALHIKTTSGGASCEIVYLKSMDQI